MAARYAFSMRQSHPPRRRRTPVMVLLIACCVLIAACSGGSGSADSGFSLTLAGSTTDRSPPQPQLSGADPGGIYAFIHGDQVWLHDTHGNLRQLTHLVLSNGAARAWGPLVWSPSGRYLAFALTQSMRPELPTRGAGPIYIVDTSDGDTFGQTSETEATGSIYGHSYAWYGDGMLFFSGGTGIMMVTPGTNGRVWQVISTLTRTGSDGVTNTYSSRNSGISDVAFVGNRLLYTAYSVTSLAGGVNASATLEEASLGTLRADQTYTTVELLRHFPLQNALTVADLGASYTDSSGTYRTGAWAVSGTTLVFQRIRQVNVTAGTVASSFCWRASLDATSDCAPVLQSAGSQSIDTRSVLSLAPDGQQVAFVGSALVLERSDGSAQRQPVTVAPVTPSWSPDSAYLAVTALAQAPTAPGGTPTAQPETNILVYHGSAPAQLLIAGGQNLSWQPHE